MRIAAPTANATPNPFKTGFHRALAPKAMTTPPLNTMLLMPPMRMARQAVPEARGPGRGLREAGTELETSGLRSATDKTARVRTAPIGRRTEWTLIRDVGGVGMRTPPRHGPP